MSDPKKVDLDAVCNSLVCDICLLYYSGYNQMEITNRLKATVDAMLQDDSASTYVFDRLNLFEDIDSINDIDR